MPSLTTQLTNVLYRVTSRVRTWDEEHPDDPVIAAGATKAVRELDAQPVQRRLAWVGARRAVLLATGTRLVCGDWEIPYEQVVSAELLAFGSLTSRGFVLRVARADGHHYQFGLQADHAWRTLQVSLAERGLPFREGEVQLTFSRGSVVSRLILLVILASWAWSKLV